MKNFKDIEQLSSYIDGQLNSSESKRLESRIESDPELASDLNDIRAARGILRKLPKRKAPRNFTLTRQMVGLKPPLPRTYSFFRFSSAFATVLLVLTFAANSLIPRGFPTSVTFSFGMGGGGAPAAAESESVATEAPAATEAHATEAPMELFSTEAATEEPSVAQDTAPVPDTFAPEESTLKDSTGESADGSRIAEPQPLISSTWQIVLLVIGLGSAAVAFAMSQIAKKKWS